LQNILVSISSCVAASKSHNIQLLSLWFNAVLLHLHIHERIVFRLWQEVCSCLISIKVIIRVSCYWSFHRLFVRFFKDLISGTARRILYFWFESICCDITGCVKRSLCRASILSLSILEILILNLLC